MKRKFYYLFFLLAALAAMPFSIQAQTCTADAGPDLTLTCITLSVQLDGSGTTGAGVTYQWSTADGNITGGASTLNPVVDQPGTYCLTVTDVVNGCTASDCVVVAQDIVPPVADAGQDQFLTCIVTSTQLQGLGSGGANFSYQWSTTTGNFTSGVNTLTPWVNAPGSYSLTVTNTANGCTATDVANVLQDIVPPVADAGPAMLLNCITPVITLAGGGTTGPQYVYQWSSPNGGLIVSAANVLNPVVNAPGTYCLTVTNTFNGCTATDCTVVNLDAVFPLVSILPPAPLTCDNISVTLQAQATGGPNLTYQWTGPGMPPGQSFLQNPVVNLPGTYCVVVTNTNNGCTSMICVDVTQDVTPPSVSVNATTMSCADPQAHLSAVATPPGAFDYQWSGLYNFSATGPYIDPLAGTEAVYTVTVTNLANGCTSTSEVQVLGDTTMPRVDALIIPVQCGSSQGEITLTPNPADQQLDIIWSTGAMGQHVTSLNPGLYIATITDNTSGCSKAVAYEVSNEAIAYVINITQVSCTGSATGAIFIQPQNGTPPFTYQWAGPGGFTSNQQGGITGLIAGTYNVTITDATGCSGMSTWGDVWIWEPSPISIWAGGTTVFPACNNDGAISIPPPTGGIPPYSFVWSGPSGFTSTLEDISGLPGGVYTLTVTDINGCTFLSSPFTVPTSQPPQVSSNVSNITTCAPGSIILSSAIPGVDMLYNWSNSETTAAITVTAAGDYTVTVTNASSGCTTLLDFSILEISDPSCTAIKGKVVQDHNSNCISDLGDTGLGGWIVEAIGTDTFYAVTAADGSYQMTALPGNFDLQVVLPNGLWAPCAPVPVTLANPGDMVSADIPVQAIVLCPAMTVDISTSQLRRCFSNNYYFVDYCNNGPAVATNAYVVVTLDPFLYYVNSNVGAFGLGNNTYKFLLGNVDPGECGSFWIKVGVHCSAVLGQTHCTEAHIYPDTLCDNDPNWSGASVLVNAQCDGDSVHFAIKNAGNAPMTTSLDYIVIEDGIMFMQAGGPPLGAGDSVSLSVPANGATWRVEAMQEPFHPEDFLPAAVVEGCTVTGSFSTGYVQQFPNPDQGQAVDIDCTANVGSYDPNDKQGMPIGYGPSHYIKPGTDLEYLIRFQNTGTDTAFNIVVRDTLSEWLDPSTVQPGASSHAYRFDLTGEGIVVFSFDDILLPDSNINEAASHGFVSFKIAQKPDVPLGADIFNRAAIYFDFNDPVLTNTTFHRIGLNFVTAIYTPDQPDATLRILPNPMSATARVELDGWTLGQRVSISIVNSTGRLLRRETAVAPQFTLDASALPEGLYFLKVESADGRSSVMRFVVGRLGF